MTKFLTIIPARAGSKGVVGKNIKALCGKPLIQYSIDAALGANLVPLVSTDGEDIATIARVGGARVPGLRPDHLATDTSTSLEVVLHALDEWAPDAQSVCLLQPTSPFRTAQHLKEALALYDGERAVISVSPVTKPPHWMYFVDETHAAMTPFMEAAQVTRRQDAPPLFALNGAIYIVPVDVLRKTRSFVPPGALGYRMSVEDALDIDTPLDWQIAESIYNNR